MEHFEFSQALFQAYSLLVLRIAAMLRLIPFFGGRPLGWLPWLALSSALAVILVPLGPRFCPEELSFASAAPGEIAIGALLGVSVRLSFSAFESAGALVRSALLPLPLPRDEEAGPRWGPDTKLFLVLIALVCFFSLSGHHALIKVLGASVECHPPGWASTGVLELQARAAPEFFLNSMTLGIAAGLAVAAPVLTASILAELFSGFFGRLFLSFGEPLPGGGLKVVVTELALAATLWFGVKIGMELLMSTLDSLSRCV